MEQSITSILNGCCLVFSDVLIISFMDTFTSMLAGVTVFSILGNLALESGKQVSDVATSGSGLAFISYPEAIGKFPVVPHVNIAHFLVGSVTSEKLLEK